MKRLLLFLLCIPVVMMAGTVVWTQDFTWNSHPPVVEIAVFVPEQPVITVMPDEFTLEFPAPITQPLTLTFVAQTHQSKACPASNPCASFVLFDQVYWDGYTWSEGMYVTAGATTFIGTPETAPVLLTCIGLLIIAGIARRNCIGEHINRIAKV
jgi:hypothetical protein